MIVNHHFDHDIELVYNTLTDPQFLQQRALELGSMEAESQSQQVEGNQQVTLLRRRKVKVPFVLRKMLKTIQTANTSELWRQLDGGYRCENNTDVDGAPLAIKGNIALSSSASGCDFRAEFETEAKVALFKKKLQKYAGKTVAKEIELECEYTARHLAGSGTIEFLHHLHKW